MSIWLKKESLLNNEVCTKASGGGGEIPTDTGEELQVAYQEQSLCSP